MLISVLLESVIRLFGYLCALHYLFFPAYRNRFWKTYRIVVLVFVAGGILGVAVGWPKNSQDQVFYELQSAALIPAALGICGLVSGLTITKTARTFIGLFSLLLVLTYLASIFLKVGFAGDLIRADSTLILYAVSFTAVTGLWLLAIGHQPWIARAIVASAWLSALFTLEKWNVLVVIGVPLVWMSIDTTGRHKALLRIFGLLLLAGAGITIVSEIDYIASSSTGGSFDDYLDHHYRTRDDPSSGRFSMWVEQVEGLFESPFTGIGFGTKAEENGVADHNAYVFYLTRFGVLLGPFFLLLLLRASASFLGISRTDKKTSGISLLLVANVAFVIAVGEVYTFSPVMNLAGALGGLLMQRGLQAQRLMPSGRFRRLQHAYSISPARFINGRLRHQPQTLARRDVPPPGPAHGGSALPLA